jgi:hypothetical protein
LQSLDNCNIQRWILMLRLGLNMLLHFQDRSCLWRIREMRWLRNVLGFSSCFNIFVCYKSCLKCFIFQLFVYIKSTMALINLMTIFGSSKILCIVWAFNYCIVILVYNCRMYKSWFLLILPTS